MITPNKIANLCSYGCGQQAKFTLKNGTRCCSKRPNLCPSYRKKLGQYKKNELCSYGCGRKGIYTLKNGKLCCSNKSYKCPGKKEQLIKTRIKNLIITTKLCSYGCGNIAKYKFKNGKLCCSDNFNKCPMYIKNKRDKIYLEKKSNK